MAKISTYVIDGTIVDDDKVIGSDANNDLQTKNYRMGDLVGFFAASIGNDFLVPYVGANDNVNLGDFNLFATDITISGIFIADGTAGLPGQALLSTGTGSPATWGYVVGSQDLASVLNIGNTGIRNINLDTINGYARIDVEKIYGEPAMYLHSNTLSTNSSWAINNLHLESTVYKADYSANKIRYTLGANYVDIIPNNYNNQSFILPTNGGFIPISVNGNFADSSGNITVSSGGGDVTGAGTTNYISKWSSSSALTDSQIFDNGTNVGIGTASPSFKLDISGTGRFTGLLGAQGDFYAGAAGSSQFDINTLSATLPNTLGFWRKFGNGNYTYLKEDEQGGAQHKWAFVRRDGFDQTRAFYQANSSILNINLGWQDPNSSNYDGNTLLINPKINITNAANTGTKIRGTYYNPTLTSLVNTTHIAYENTSGDIIHGNLSGGSTRMVTADSTGKLGVATIPAGTVTSVAALTLGTSGTDLSSTVATGTTTPIITLNVPTASAANRGALSTTDWTTFNNKLSNDPVRLGYQALGSTIKGASLAVYQPKDINGVVSLTPGNIILSAYYLPTAVTVTGMRWWQSIVSTFTAATYNGFGLYSVSGGTLTLVASSTDDSTVFTTGANTWKSKAFTTPYSAAAGVYYVALCYNTTGAGTHANIGIGVSSIGFGVFSLVDMTNSNRFSPLLVGTSLPSTQATSGFTNSGNNYGLFLY